MVGGGCRGGDGGEGGDRGTLCPGHMVVVVFAPFFLLFCHVRCEVQ